MPPASVSSKYTRIGHLKPISAPGQLVDIFMAGVLPERALISQNGGRADAGSMPGRPRSAAMNGQARKRLRDRHDFDRVDVDMRWTGRDSVDRISHILGSQLRH